TSLKQIGAIFILVFLASYAEGQNFSSATVLSGSGSVQISHKLRGNVRLFLCLRLCGSAGQDFPAEPQRRKGKRKLLKTFIA
ncbi:MAG: hypothetical protein ABIV48_02130, partial [Pyrinomonadaceae bacterium]